MQPKHIKMRLENTNPKSEISIQYQMKKIAFLLAFILCQLSLTKAQTTVKNPDLKSPKVDGTYQIEMINTRTQPMLPVTMIKTVQENRDSTQVKYIMLATQTRLKILPYSEINKPDFKPLPRIVYVAK